ncbi:recombinase family protein [Clostridium botulinum]|uniref:recombinase family protein n=1 Tax=Clostridium botulinum TaxID=1491 RepID=UPI0007730131|nr:recombinase family protein [Clostridium botulinum]
MSKIYGYCRCSTNENKQDISRQERDLKALGVTNKKNIYKEYESGTKIKRAELEKLLEKVEEGDTIIATEVSRITRSTKQLCEIIEFAKNKHIKLILGTFMVDCTKELDPMTEGMLKMMGVFSELERNMISQRVKSGVANARAKGKIIGRPALTIETMPNKVKDMYELFNSGSISKTDYAKICNISRPTLDKYLNIIKSVKEH